LNERGGERGKEGEIARKRGRKNEYILFSARERKGEGKGVGKGGEMETSFQEKAALKREEGRRGGKKSATRGEEEMKKRKDFSSRSRQKEGQGGGREKGKRGVCSLFESKEKGGGRVVFINFSFGRGERMEEVIWGKGEDREGGEHFLKGKGDVCAFLRREGGKGGPSPYLFV